MRGLSRPIQPIILRSWDDVSVSGCWRNLDRVAPPGYHHWTPRIKSQLWRHSSRVGSDRRLLRSSRSLDDRVRVLKDLRVLLPRVVTQRMTLGRLLLLGVSVLRPRNRRRRLERRRRRWVPRERRAQDITSSCWLGSPARIYPAEVPRFPSRRRLEFSAAAAAAVYWPWPRSCSAPAVFPTPPWNWRTDSRELPRWRGFKDRSWTSAGRRHCLCSEQGRCGTRTTWVDEFRRRPGLRHWYITLWRPPAFDPLRITPAYTILMPVYKYSSKFHARRS